MFFIKVSGQYNLLIVCFKPFYSNDNFIYPLKTSELEKFYNVFRGIDTETGSLKWVSENVEMKLLNINKTGILTKSVKYFYYFIFIFVEV